MGHPVSHSLAPAMHNAALQVMGLDYIYVPLPIPVANLPTAIAGLKCKVPLFMTCGSQSMSLF